jgi:hypothetical protein
MSLCLLSAPVRAETTDALQAQISKLSKIVAIQEARLQNLDSHRAIVTSVTSRPGSYGNPELSISPRKGGEGAAEMPKFGDTIIKLPQARKVFVSATVTFRPGPYSSSALGAAVTAKKGNQVVVLHDSLNPLKSLNRGSGDGPYFKPSQDAYSTIPISGVLELPEGGDWTLQLLIENSGAEPVQVHTYSLTGIAI